MITKIDKVNKFVSKFDPKTGFYIRSGVIENGKDTGVDPFMTVYPELIDIGVMGNCIHGQKGLCATSGVMCYQSGRDKHLPNMSPADYAGIISECKGKTFQVALGGRGDVNKHEEFEFLLKFARQHDIVPNYTTSGLDLSLKEVELTAEHCGAVAVSWYRAQHTMRALTLFIAVGMKTNIHYVLSKRTIDEAIWHLKYYRRDEGVSTKYFPNPFPKGINAVIFLLHKPVGLGTKEDVLEMDDPRVKEFFALIDKGDYPFKLGFDSCTVPGLINMTKSIEPASMDTCEGGRWSMYISADMKALPCSFDQAHRWAVDLKDYTIEEAWNSDQFWDFRDRMNLSCKSCSIRKDCYGGCPIVHDIVLCDKSEKDKA